MISAKETEAIQTERRYRITPSVASDQESSFSRYLQHTKPLTSEPWELMTLSPKSALHKNTVTKAAITFIGLLTLWLLYRNYKQQRRLVTYEQQHSKELEEKVRERTEELERAQDALISESNYVILGRMSAAINHEINQPLTTLRLNLASLRQLISEPIKNVDDIEQTVIESDRTTKRITRVITSLRNYARSNSMNLERVVINDLINESISTINVERPLMSKHVVVKSSDNTISLYADRVLIQQALLNLLYNAIDAALQVLHPSITLELSDSVSADELRKLIAGATISRSLSDLNKSTKYIAITVTDNGAGVPLHIADTLFEPFTTDKPNHQGLGLGLTIANQIAEGHRGALTYIRKNNNSAFSLILPLQHD
jgi:two-component system C4-dicarboxylate transport sensor histidine kinase DctB